jgi:hypothetical protein
MWITDPLGQLVPPGLTGKTVYEWNVGDDTALPSWLTAPSGTVTFPARLSTGGRGLVRVATGIVVGNTAELALAHTINLAATGLMGVEWTIAGLSFVNQSSFDIEVSMTNGASIGVGFRELNTSGGTAHLGYNGFTVTDTCEYPFRLTGPKSITLVCSPPSGDVGAFRAGRDLHYLKRTGFTTGTVTPRIKITTQTTAEKYFEIGYVSLKLWTN